MSLLFQNDKLSKSKRENSAQFKTLTVSCGRSSTSVFGGTVVLCRRNLSLHCISGGYSRWAWRVTADPAVSWKPLLQKLLKK